MCVYRMDKLHMALTELCFAINYCSVISVWEHGFVPRDFFTQHLELRFNKYYSAFHSQANHRLLCTELPEDCLAYKFWHLYGTYPEISHSENSEE